MNLLDSTYLKIFNYESLVNAYGKGFRGLGKVGLRKKSKVAAKSERVQMQYISYTNQ